MQPRQHGRILKGPGAHRVKPLHEQNIKKARDFALAETMKHQRKVLDQKRAIKSMSKLYVGNLHCETTNENSIHIQFERFGIILGITVFREQRYLRPESVKLASEIMDGLNVMGRCLKVHASIAIPKAMLNELAHVKGEWMFITSIRLGVEEKDIIDLYRTYMYGEVLAFKLYQDLNHPGKHKGSGFVQYTKEEDLDSAMAGIRSIDLGGGSGFLQYKTEEGLNSGISGIRGINLGGRLLLLQKYIIQPPASSLSASSLCTTVPHEIKDVTMAVSNRMAFADASSAKK